MGAMSHFPAARCNFPLPGEEPAQENVQRGGGSAAARYDPSMKGRIVMVRKV